MVILIVLTSRRMQTVTNYFIANLALADVVIGLFSIPFQFQVVRKFNQTHINDVGKSNIDSHMLDEHYLNIKIFYKAFEEIFLLEFHRAGQVTL